MSATSARLYRNILREISKSSVFRPVKHPVITANLRNVIVNRAAQDTTPSKDLQNLISFLSADRHYKELLQRYSPLHDLSEEERIKATARRVGLDTPEEYKPSS